MKELLKKATLKQLRQCLINKEFTSVELTGVSLSLAEADKTNSFITLSHEKALAAAENADKKLAQKCAQPLCGIPLSVKDNICTKGIKTTCASKMLEDFIPPYSATAVERLEQDGGVIIGKTNMDEFAMGSSSKTSYFGRVLNPCNENYVAGGSSGGSAAAVAAGICPASLGSDTGGSIRQPASFCGVTAIKPTYGTVSRQGLIAFASSLDQIGVVAKTAEDCAIILSTIAGKDGKDMTCVKEKEEYEKDLEIGLKGKTIGIPSELLLRVDEEVLTAFWQGIEAFKDFGCRVKTISLPFNKFSSTVYSVISSAEAASNLARYDGIRYGHRTNNGETFEEALKSIRGEAFGFEVKRRIMLGNFVLSDVNFEGYYKRATQLRQKIKELYNNAFNECDVILNPTAPTTAFPVKDGVLNEFSEAADVLTLPVNLAGLPSVTTTCGYDKSGLPIGLSITAPAFCDKLALGFAHRFENGGGRK